MSQKIYSLFQSSYTVEAKLLKAVDFPPLKRPLENYINSKTDFFGYTKNNALAGIIEIYRSDKNIHINSLVVSPKYFRQGIGKKLMQYVLETFGSTHFSAETGVDNIPAITLYKSLGFVELKQWNTDHGIRKVKFEKHINTK